MDASKFVQRGGRQGAAIGGLALGGIGAAIGSMKRPGKKNDTKSRAMRSAVGGLSFGAIGALHGHNVGGAINADRWLGGHRPKPAMPDWLKNAKTKAEARRAYHQQARKVHPDLGGNLDATKKLNQEWAAHEKLYKEAMYAAFSDELKKIAVAGALIGGAAGYKLAPGGLKNKMVGAAMGAGLGMAVSGLARGAKQAVWDEPRARERSELYGYVPSSVTNPNPYNGASFY